MTQSDKVYKHLLETGSIDSREAFNLCGCVDIHPVIKELEKRGIKLDKEHVRIVCNNGMQTTIVKYYLR